MVINEVGLVLYFCKRGFIIKNNTIVTIAQQVSHSVFLLHVKVTDNFAGINLTLFRTWIELFAMNVDVLVEAMRFLTAGMH